MYLPSAVGLRKNGSAALVDLAGGHVQLMISNIINCMPYVRNKRLHALGISSAKASPLLPQLPAIAASGLPGYASAVISGFLAPAKTPPDIVARLNREIVAVLGRADVRERLLSAGVEAAASTPEQFAQTIACCFPLKTDPSGIGNFTEN